MQRPYGVDYSPHTNKIGRAGVQGGGQFLNAPYNGNLYAFKVTAPYSKTLGAAGDLMSSEIAGIPVKWILIGLGAWFFFGKRR